MNITHLKLRFSNAYLLRGHKTVIVDTGMPGEEDHILRAVDRAGVRSLRADRTSGLTWLIPHWNAPAHGSGLPSPASLERGRG